MATAAATAVAAAHQLTPSSAALAGLSSPLQLRLQQRHAEREPDAGGHQCRRVVPAAHAGQAAGGYNSVRAVGWVGPPCQPAAFGMSRWQLDSRQHAEHVPAPADLPARPRRASFLPCSRLRPHLLACGAHADAGRRRPALALPLRRASAAALGVPPLPLLLAAPATPGRSPAAPPSRSNAWAHAPSLPITIVACCCCVMKE